MKLKLFLALIAIVGRLFKLSLTVSEHNGEDLLTYPERKWTLVPFPSAKGKIYNNDNMATVNRHEFVRKQRFIGAKIKAQARWVDSNRDISWRLHTVIWAAGMALNSKVSGSMIVECGTGRGFMAAAITEYYKFGRAAPELYLIDAFSRDLVQEDGESTESPASFAYTDDVEEVRDYFRANSSVSVLKGFIPNILDDLPKKPISFLHIDLNSVVAERATLEFFRNRLGQGSIILFDDYGGFGADEQAIVHETFAMETGQELLILPTGQALIFWQSIN